MEGNDNLPVGKSKEDKKGLNLKMESPTPEELNGKYEDLVEKAIPQWRRNHQKLLKVIQSGNLPFFGLHGAPGNNLNNILKNQRGHLEMTTFYRKDITENFLYQLYYACYYASCYTHIRGGNSTWADDTGGILIFNLEEAGENMTLPWENLFPGGLYLNLATDSPDEEKAFESLRARDNLPFRTDFTFHRDEFEQHFKGMIEMNDLRKYLMGPNTRDDTVFARTILQSRFLAQEILARVFKLLEN